jgi:hypothetical protein
MRLERRRRKGDQRKHELGNNRASAATDPCLQVADYCAWVIQRKWERGDTVSYDMIREKIATEFDLWKNGPNHYY